MKDVITNLTITNDITLVTLANAPADTETLAELFEALGKKLNIDMVSMTPPYKGTINISFTINDDDLHEAIAILKDMSNEKVAKLRLDINSNNCKISLYGEKMKTTPGVFAKTMSLLSREKVEVKLITTSEVDISYLIYSADQNRAVDTIQNYFDDVNIIVE